MLDLTTVQIIELYASGLTPNAIAPRAGCTTDNIRHILKVNNISSRVSLRQNSTSCLCLRCNQRKPLSEFGRRHYNKNKCNSWCKSCVADYSKGHFKVNKDHIHKVHKQYYDNNKDDIVARNVINRRQYRILDALNNNTKSTSTMELIGCSIEELKDYLQKTAIKNGYRNFDINSYSGKDYHIDHIKPCSLFDLSDPLEQTKCFHYNNLQILTASENNQKYNKY